MRDPNAAARLARAFGRDRFFVELQRPYERGDARRNAALRDLAATLGVADGRDRRRPRAPPAAGRRSRTCSSRSATAPRSTAASASGAATASASCVAPGEMAERFPHDRDAVARTAELADAARVRPDRGARLPLPGLLRRRRARDVQLARVCDHAFEDALRRAPTATSAGRARRLDEELALIGELGLAGFFLLHWEVLELAREVAREVRGARLAAARRCRRAAGAAARSARSSAT